MEEREAKFMIATGMMGVGKSYVTEEFLRVYYKTHKRKILIFDPNNEETYHHIPAVYFDVLDVQKARAIEKKDIGRSIQTKSEQVISSLPQGSVCRVLPFTRHGRQMSIEQKQVTMTFLCEHFRGGLLLLEDVNKYITNFEAEEIQGAFKAIRHQSQDVIMHCQSLRPLRPIHLEACQVIRMHYDGVNVSQIKDRLEGIYELLRIAQIIVENEYWKGGKKNERFHLYVHLKQQKIQGATTEQFMAACEQFLTSNKAYLNDIASEIAYRNGRQKPNYQDNLAARRSWITKYSTYLPNYSVQQVENAVENG